MSPQARASWPADLQPASWRGIQDGHPQVKPEKESRGQGGKWINTDQSRASITMTDQSWASITMTDQSQTSITLNNEWNALFPGWPDLPGQDDQGLLRRRLDGDLPESLQARYQGEHRRRHQAVNVSQFEFVNICFYSELFASIYHATDLNLDWIVHYCNDIMFTPKSVLNKQLCIIFDDAMCIVYWLLPRSLSNYFSIMNVCRVQPWMLMMRTTLCLRSPRDTSRRRWSLPEGEDSTFELSFLNNNVWTTPGLCQTTTSRSTRCSARRCSRPGASATTSGKT